ncbi:ATP synthase gamma chain 2 chloroplastic [Phtheirospermum japonicum]|uniref:F-ATPase gamma subunit n=1 Tax=Phtheirospermum japonicum TaxID=374723 RepID=A0A830CFX8_9LAMI|nr:ATP synthase gamma chain 2 chloroplastic [Phtheirospermum japonicum]
MLCVNLLTGIAPNVSTNHLDDSISFKSQLNPFPTPNPSKSHSFRSPKTPSIQNGLRELRQRIETVKNTQKVTEATKLVAAAKVRRAQEAVVNGRPFAQTLAEVLFEINEQCQLDDVETPLTAIRPVKRVALIVITGDRGLCGGFNTSILKKAHSRVSELNNLKLDCNLISVGKKGNAYYRKQPNWNVDRFIEGDYSFPTTKEAQVIADDVFSLFLTEEVDRVELLYTKFVSLVKSEPIIHTLLPLSRDADEKNEFFRLTTNKGKLSVERENGIFFKKNNNYYNNCYEFEQDPAQILDALMPLYLNSQILRALQESYASELAARMNAMSNATDNAVDLKRSLSVAYNRERQAKITGEILEIVAGAEALRER